VAEKFALLNPKEVAKEQATHKSVSWSAREKRVRAGARWEGVKLVLLSQIRIKRATKRATRRRSIHEIERNASLRNEIKALKGQAANLIEKKMLQGIEPEIRNALMAVQMNTQTMAFRRWASWLPLKAPP